MFYPLTICFGGLCLFVEKDADDKEGIHGLHVLMPRMDMPGMTHCPMIVTDPVYTKQAGATLESLPPANEYRRDIATAGTRVGQPGNVLAVSRYAGKTVNPACLQWCPDLTGNLAWRMVLPLGSTITPVSKLAKLIVPDGKGNYNSDDFVGMVNVDVPENTSPTFTVGKTTFYADAKNLIKLIILNVPKSEVWGVMRGSSLGGKVDHVDAYYTLMGDGKASGPPILYGSTNAASGDPAPYANCPTLPEVPPDVWSGWHPHPGGGGKFPYAVDPNNCTVGYGCPLGPC